MTRNTMAAVSFDDTPHNRSTVWADEGCAPKVVALPVGTAVMISLVSPYREGTNQDAAAVIPLPRNGALLAVADGVGGGPDGALASRLAVRTLGERMATVSDKDDAVVRGSLLQAIEAANDAVLNLGSGAATTLALLHVGAGVARPYHVGDSWVLHVGGRGKLKHRSIDHGPVGYAVESGMLHEQDAMHHEERHVVTNIVGATDMRLEVGPLLHIKRRDTLVIASDGLSDNLYLEEIADIIRRGPLVAAAEILVERCRQQMMSAPKGQPSKADDLTFVLYRP